jgi:hypothetical protein
MSYNKPLTFLETSRLRALVEKKTHPATRLTCALEFGIKLSHRLQFGFENAHSCLIFAMYLILRLFVM